VSRAAIGLTLRFQTFVALSRVAIASAIHSGLERFFFLSSRAFLVLFGSALLASCSSKFSARSIPLHLRDR